MTDSQIKRTGYKFKHPGPYLAMVKNHLDPEFNGSVQVALISGAVDNADKVAGQYVTVRYCSPFAGNTSVDFNDEPAPSQKAKFNGTQKSYGMWMTPPDVGNMVMVFFIEGYRNQGYWFGCITDKYTNNMTPGIASIPLPASALDPEEINTYGRDPLSDPKSPTYYLPVAEINKNSKDSQNFPPVHTPFAQQLLRQGLLYDRVRGGTSSSARREAPSAVFGISTPGPFDVITDHYQRRSDSYGGDPLSSKLLPASRLGGNQFVMDDGDISGENELIRLRTRSGAQILLHNSKDLVYITNSGGTAWIEMTSMGKIDIYAQDSVSIHSEQDFNFRADRNFNIEAGQNVNIKSFGNINIDAGANLSALVKTDVLISSSGKLVVTSTGSINLKSDDAILSQSKSETGITASKINLTAPTDIQGKITSVGGELNGSPASAKAPDTTPAPAIPLKTKQYTSGSALWPDNYYQAGQIQSTMRRLPTHEPWSEHEDINPSLYTPDQTGNDSPIAPAVPDPEGPKLGEPPGNPAIGFAGGQTGTLAAFNKLTKGMQKAIIWAAETYYKTFAKSLIITSAYRSYNQQVDIRNAWKAAGGSSTRPTVNTVKYGTLTTPAEDSKHSLGTAVDVPVYQAKWLAKSGVLKTCGLSQPSPQVDPGHIQLG